ncbi:hypothetical protein ACFXNW_23610 [Nocardia sp. NPDC059180]|uniref:hypothetical protein n=1 Tax=Nocardia sp. NPDC059180 TaxID=3346761 RepID=UPI0036B73361
MPILGPPAVGKTTLTLALEATPMRQVFRLREHVPVDILAATTSAVDRLGWIDDSVIEPTVRNYLERATEDPLVHTVLLDNFPGTSRQARMLIDALTDIAPQCKLEPVELVLDERARKSRARRRRVCHHCEKDPIDDPRIPAVAAASNSWKCGRCGSLLHPRRSDAPSLFAARSRRHEDTTGAIRETFAQAGYPITTLDADIAPTVMARRLEPMLISRSRTA